MVTDHEGRVLVLAPTDADAEITSSLLGDAAISCHVCRNTSELLGSVREGAGAILITEEILALDDAHALRAELRRQPAWSDVPIVLLCGARSAAALTGETVDSLGNVTVLERPVRVANLVSALRSALRARRRQYQIRDQLMALQLAEERLREADRRKDEFLAILAHELRNPLAPARNAAHLLKLQSTADPELQHASDMIERQISQMARLIEDLLDVSRISRGLLALRRERLAFADVLNVALDACRHDIQSRRHTLRTRMPAQSVILDADRDRLVQVITNLVTNATKYTPPGGHIEVAAEMEGETLVVSVRDDGIGIPPEKLTEIFELFAQVDRSFDRQAGLGIGLTLVRQLVGLHGGTIEAHSEGVGRGSLFVVRLPVARVQALPRETPPEQPMPSGEPMRVLIADDNRDAAESLGLLLRMTRHEVRIALDGEAATAAAREFHPDVALLDISMPKRDGFDVARDIRREPWGASVYLVALTGWGQEKDRRLAREAGFDAHLVKPVAPRALNDLLAERSRSLAS
jgi:two-component system, sensor histidine kinase